MSQDFPPADPLAFLKDIWAQAGIPFPATMPAADAEAIDKKIAELKAVQGWLQTNLALLQSTIQMLEMQKTGMHAMQDASASTQAATELWMKALEQYAAQVGAPDDKPSSQKAGR